MANVSAVCRRHHSALALFPIQGPGFSAPLPSLHAQLPLRASPGRAHSGQSRDQPVWWSFRTPSSRVGSRLDCQGVICGIVAEFCGASVKRARVRATAGDMGLEVQRPPMEAWYMDDSAEDQRKPHHRNPPEYVPLAKLDELGVLHWVLDADIYGTDPELKRIRNERGYNYEDFIEVCPDKLPNYEMKIKTFFEEHIHTDEEIRYCLDGSGYFDVRDPEDRWIRIWVHKGDMIVLPAGCYHRFTLDENNYLKAMRLFIGEPIWTPYNRPQDEHPVRMDYIDHFLKSHKMDMSLAT